MLSIVRTKTGPRPTSQRTTPMTSRPPHPEDYRPYNTLPAFMEGYHAYSKGNWMRGGAGDSVEQQAWDRGLDYAMRLNRWNKSGA
jgi:hypothetical protein